MLSDDSLAKALYNEFGMNVNPANPERYWRFAADGIRSRWLVAHDAEVARKTLEDAADALYGNSALGIDLRNWLRARAASISTDKAEAGFHAPDCADCGTPKTQENADRKLWELHEWPCPLFYIGHWVDGKPERNCACDNPSTDKAGG